MTAQQPVWRQAFDLAEAAAAPRVEALVQSEPFRIAVGLATQARKAVQGRAERSMRRALHTWNLPAGSDVTRILNELGRLQRDVRSLARRLDAVGETSPTKGGANGAAGRGSPAARAARR